MAGWDHEFDVDARDVDLAKACFRVWRRTCARYHAEFTYRRERRAAGGRVRFLLGYDARTASMPPAVAEFAIEMRAVSMLQQGRRRALLPIRLLRDVAFVNLPPSVEEELDPKIGPGRRRAEVVKLLEDQRAAAAAYSRGEISAADLLEAQHSCITNLALFIAAGAHKRKDSYPVLVDKLTPDRRMRGDLKRLGEWRNEVKHRDNRALAPTVIDEAIEIVWLAVHTLTGVYLEAVSPSIAALSTDEQAAFKLPPMFMRFGEPRVTRR